MVPVKGLAATTAVCRHCGNRFPLNLRAGRNTGRGSRRAISYAPARYCSDAHRKAASRARGSSAVTETRLKSSAGTIPLSAVTSPLQPIELSREITTKKTVPDRRIVPDPVWPGMFRIRKASGELTDMANLTRIKDALAYAVAATRR
jgi:hypothetical protein